MHKFTKIQKRLILANVLVLAFGLLMLGLRQNPLTNFGFSAWTYIRYGLIDYPVTSLVNFAKDASNLWQVHQDNVYLNEELARQRSYQTMYQEERNRNEELQSMLDIKNALPQSTSISCVVLERSPSSWSETFTASAGTAQGVKKNMLVISSEGAVGLVDEVQTNSCTVQLLSSNDLINDIAIAIPLEDGTTVEGILQSYDAQKRAYCINLFDNDANITAGQTVATSGKGGNYPAGVFVGTVMETVVNDDAIIKTVYVKPVSNLNSFNYVTILGQEVRE